MSYISEIIRPSADLRNHYSEVSKECRDGKRAVIITVNGHGDTVSLGYEQYQDMKARLELLEILGESEQDISNGKFAPMKDSFDRLRADLKKGAFV